jgi:hypothetical protein
VRVEFDVQILDRIDGPVLDDGRPVHLAGAHGRRAAAALST